MGKIATEQEAFEKRDPSKLVLKLTEPHKCCTKERADYFGCRMSGEYESNQLIQNDDLLMPKQRNQITLQQGSLKGGGVVYFRTLLKATYPVTSKLTVTVYCVPDGSGMYPFGNRDFIIDIGDDTVNIGSIAEINPTESQIVSGTPEEDETYKYVYGFVISV